jgi:hypothetical protein
MNFRNLAQGAVVIIAAGSFASTAMAQTVSGGRQGQGGRGDSYTATKNGSTITGSVQTNRGRGATLNHTGGVSDSGVRSGATTVTTNNGSSVTTKAAGRNGYVTGTVTATGPNGQTVERSGAAYIPPR